jgi:hypothetical protein
MFSEGVQVCRAYCSTSRSRDTSMCSCNEHSLLQQDIIVVVLVPQAGQLRHDKGQEPLLENGECKSGRRTLRIFPCFMNADGNIMMPTRFIARTCWTVHVMLSLSGTTCFATALSSFTTDTPYPEHNTFIATLNLYYLLYQSLSPRNEECYVLRPFIYTRFYSIYQED